MTREQRGWRLHIDALLLLAVSVQWSHGANYGSISSIEVSTLGASTRLLLLRHAQCQASLFRFDRNLIC